MVNKTFTDEMNGRIEKVFAGLPSPVKEKLIAHFAYLVGFVAGLSNTRDFMGRLVLSEEKLCNKYPEHVETVHEMVGIVRDISLMGDVRKDELADWAIELLS